MTDDTISKKAAIDALGYCQTYLFDSFDKDKKISLEDAEYAIEQLPPAEPEQQWILCSERLPEDGTWCLFTDGENMSVERYKADAIDAFFPTGRWFDLDDAVAWMPLPKPWKGEQDG